MHKSHEKFDMIRYLQIFGVPTFRNISFPSRSTFCNRKNTSTRCEILETSGTVRNGEKERLRVEVMHPWGLISVAPHKRAVRDHAIVSVTLSRRAQRTFRVIIFAPDRSTSCFSFYHRGSA